MANKPSPSEIILELDGAVDQMHGLSVLLETAALHPPASGPWSDDVACGFIQLTSATRDRLFAARDAAKRIILADA